ncbi:hypothetical protein VTO73DRAFT_11598 [Trametes versicolor]
MLVPLEHTRPPPLDDTFGAYLVGTFIGLVLLGVTICQAYGYARAFPGDPLRLKILVALAVSLEIVSSGMNIHSNYYHMVTNFFHPENIGPGVWSDQLQPLTCVRAPWSRALAA